MRGLIRRLWQRLFAHPTSPPRSVAPPSPPPPPWTLADPAARTALADFAEWALGGAAGPPPRPSRDDRAIHTRAWRRPEAGAEAGSSRADLAEHHQRVAAAIADLELLSLGEAATERRLAALFTAAVTRWLPHHVLVGPSDALPPPQGWGGCYFALAAFNVAQAALGGGSASGVTAGLAVLSTGAADDTRLAVRSADLIAAHLFCDALGRWRDDLGQQLQEATDKLQRVRAGLTGAVPPRASVVARQARSALQSKAADLDAEVRALAAQVQTLRAGLAQLQALSPLTALLDSAPSGPPDARSAGWLADLFLEPHLVGLQERLSRRLIRACPMPRENASSRHSPGVPEASALAREFGLVVQHLWPPLPERGRDLRDRVLALARIYLAWAQTWPLLPEEFGAWPDGAVQQTWTGLLSPVREWYEALAQRVSRDDEAAELWALLHQTEPASASTGDGRPPAGSPLGKLLAVANSRWARPVRLQVTEETRVEEGWGE